MTIDEVVKSFRRTRPHNVEQALAKTGVSLTYLSEGVFRRAYQIGNLPLVAKFPYFGGDDYSKFRKNNKYRDDEFAAAIHHSNIEMKALKRILRSKKKYKPVQPYMPKVYHCNAKTGVVIQHKYTALPENKESHKLCANIEKAVVKVLGHWKTYRDFDCHTANVGKDENGNLVILDLGCFEDQDSVE